MLLKYSALSVRDCNSNHFYTVAHRQCEVVSLPFTKKKAKCAHSGVNEIDLITQKVITILLLFSTLPMICTVSRNTDISLLNFQFLPHAILESTPAFHFGILTRFFAAFRLTIRHNQSLGRLKIQTIKALNLHPEVNSNSGNPASDPALAHKFATSNICSLQAGQKPEFYFIG